MGAFTNFVNVLVYVPQSKHAHLIAGPANVFFGRLSNPGKLEKIDFEDETQETFGVGKIEDFRQNQLIDLYACRVWPLYKYVSGNRNRKNVIADGLNFKTSRSFN